MKNIENILNMLQEGMGLMIICDDNKKDEAVCEVRFKKSG